MKANKAIKRIAMWSGPRNISTAMMRAWENRADTVVVDEPLYGHYLQHTQIDHPGAAAIIAAQGGDWRQGLARCFVDLPSGKTIHYQKHMVMHWLDSIDRRCLAKLEHCFLIRHPAEVLASYTAVRQEASLYDLGFVQQAALYDYFASVLKQAVVVIDSKDFLLNPPRMLGKLCAALGVDFSEAMLSWPAGKRNTDGIWGQYWYASVEQSRGFAPYKAKQFAFNQAEQAIVTAAMPYYKQLYNRRL